MKTTRKLLGTALAFAFAAILAGCGDDGASSSSGPDNGGNGGGGGLLIDGSDVEKTKEVARKIGNALQTGDYSELAEYGIDAACARDDACMSLGIGRMLEAAGVTGIEPECLLDEECFGPWMDSVYGAADWSFSGDPLYDNACHLFTSNGFCVEMAWNSTVVDAEDNQDYRTACGALDAFLPMGGGVASSNTLIGRCPAKKILCTLESESETGWIEATYGSTDAACGKKDKD